MSATHHTAVPLATTIIIIITIICPLADSYVVAAAHEAGSAAEEEAARKTAKYSNIHANHISQPVAGESLGPIK